MASGVVAPSSIPSTPSVTTRSRLAASLTSAGVPEASDSSTTLGIPSKCDGSNTPSLAW